MRTLFFRIFASFLLAMVLVIAGTSIVVATFTWRASVALQSLDINELVTAAQRELNTGGQRQLVRWVRRQEIEHPGLGIFVVGPDARPLTERPMPEFLVRRIQRLIREGYFSDGGSPAPMLLGDPLRSIPQVTAANGTRYTMLFSLTPWLTRDVLGSPLVQMAMLLVVLCVSGTVCWYLARWITRPITLLQNSARALAGGDLSARVGDEFIRRRDELSVLAHDFDQMADRLRELIASKEVLLRDVSHELRTPLARLQLALGLARREGADLNREFDRIEREAERLDELIGEILRLARLNAVQAAVDGDDFDYADLISDIVEDARMEATAQHKQVAWRPPGRLQVHGDQSLLRSAIENVLRNALRYTAPETTVELSLRREQGRALLTIRDHGPGVPQAELSRLFEPFYRVTQQARERDSGGYGLGLAITARVMQAHHGRVEATNAPDGGLQVVLILPVEQPATATQTGGLEPVVATH